MSWQVLLKAPSISGEQELPDTKLMYAQYLSFSGGANIIRQIIETNKSNRGIRNIPNWNRQIINTNTDRLGRQFPQIKNIEDVQRNAKELVKDMEKLTTRDVSYKSIETKLKDLIDAQDFEGIENFLQVDKTNTGGQIRGKIKKAILTNINDLKQLILSNPPDKYIHAYYYDISKFNLLDVDLPKKDFSTTDLGEKLKGWVQINNGNIEFVNKEGSFEGKIPPFVKVVLEEALNRTLSMVPSRLVKYIGGDISPGMVTSEIINSEYTLNVTDTEDVLNYLMLLTRLGINTNEFMLSDTPSDFYNLILKKKESNSPMVYPALKIILNEPSFDIDKWHTSEKGTKDERALSHIRDKFLREWTVTRIKGRTDSEGEKVKTTESNISEDKQQLREVQLGDKGYEDLRTLFSLSATERKRKLKANKNNIREIYNHFMEKSKESLWEGRMLFSEENYDFLVSLEKEIESGTDTTDKLMTYFNIEKTSAESLYIILNDIVTNPIMGEKYTLSNFFKEPRSVGKGPYKYTGRLFNTHIREDLQLQNQEKPEEDLVDLVEDINALFKFLKDHRQTVKPSEQKSLIQALKGMEADDITVDDFSPTNLVLEDIIEMMCQINWLLGDKSLNTMRNQLISSIKAKKTKTIIPKFITTFEDKYSEIRTQLIKATKTKVNKMIESDKSIGYYDKLVRNKYKYANFFNRLVDENLVIRV